MPDWFRRRRHDQERDVGLQGQILLADQQAWSVGLTGFVSYTFLRTCMLVHAKIMPEERQPFSFWQANIIQHPKVF